MLKLDEDGRGGNSGGGVDGGEKRGGRGLRDSFAAERDEVGTYGFVLSDGKRGGASKNIGDRKGDGT